MKARRPTRRHRFVDAAAPWRGSLVITVLALLATGALGQDAISVPGGPASFRRLFGLDPQRPDATFFLDLHEILLFDSPENASWSKIESRVRAVRFVEDLAEWRRLFGNPAHFAAAPAAEWTRCAAALDWLGYTVEGTGVSFTLQRRSDPASLRRQSFLDVLGTPTSIFLAQVRAGETVAILAEDGGVPLPFGLTAWRETLSQPRLAADDAFVFFLKDVRASRMLVALLDLDPETREELRVFLGAPNGGPLGWKLLYEDALDSFSRYPEALVLRGGRFVLPGGPSADALWTEVFGVAPTERRAFLKALYTRDGGKAAYVVDVLQHLSDEKTQALLFAQGAPGFRRLYASIDAEGENYDRTHRDPYDFAHLAPFVRTAPESRPAGAVPVSGGREFPRSEADLAGIVARQTSAGAAGPDSLRTLFQPGAGSRGDGFSAQRRFLLLTRLLDDNPALADPGLLILLDRGADRVLPAYAILGDLPFPRPDLARTYVFTLDRLERRGGSREGEVIAGLFQGDIVLLSQLFRAGALDAVQAEALFSELLDLALFARPDASLARHEAELFAWLSRRLLPVLREQERLRGARAEGEEAGDSDDLIERALVGWPALARIEWRGGHYRVDPAADEAARRRAFRETQRLTWIADLEALHRQREELLEAAARGDLVGAKAAAAELAEGLGIADPRGRSDTGDERTDKTEVRASEAAAKIGSLQSAEGLSRVPARAEAIDALLAERHLEALLGHVYAASAGDPDSLYYQDPSFVRRHSFRTVESGGVPVRTAFTATELIEGGQGGGSRISGSLFGLTDVLGLLHADQLPYRAGAKIPSEAIRAGLVAPIWRMSVSRLDDDSLQVVADSCRATVEFADRLASSSPPERFSAWDAVARGLVPRSRLTLLAALDGAPSEEELARFLSPSDFYRIGRRLLHRAPLPDADELPALLRAREAMARLEKRHGEAGSRERLAEFGPRATAYAGCPRLADLEMPPYERLAAYRRPELLSERLYDLKIAVACRVAHAQLPAAVLPIVLAESLDELLVQLSMAYPYDWSATTRAAFAFSSGDLERILDGAVQAGRLVRDDEPPPPTRAGS